jgi:hypothetical protein
MPALAMVKKMTLAESSQFLQTMSKVRCIVSRDTTNSANQQ